MIKLFRRKTELEKLEDVHRKLLKQAFKYSKSNRKLSDNFILQASEIEKKIDELKKNDNISSI